MVEIHRFAYRAPRFAVALPLELLVEGTVTQGQSCDLSEHGILVRLRSPVLPGSRGRLRLHVDSCAIEIAVEVAHAELHEAGLHFHFASEVERAFVGTLIKVVSRAARAGEPMRRGLMS